MIGKRSAKAQQNAINLGYKNTKNYLGSWNDWASKTMQYVLLKLEARNTFSKISHKLLNSKVIMTSGRYLRIEMKSTKYAARATTKRTATIKTPQSNINVEKNSFCLFVLRDESKYLRPEDPIQLMNTAINTLIIPASNAYAPKSAGEMFLV